MIQPLKHVASAGKTCRQRRKSRLIGLFSFFSNIYIYIVFFFWLILWFSFLVFVFFRFVVSLLLIFVLFHHWLYSMSLFEGLLLLFCFLFFPGLRRPTQIIVWF